MDAIRQYILSVICTAILCGLVQLFFYDSSTRSLVKLITGVILTITVAAPIMQDNEFSLDTYFGEIAANGEWAVIDGEVAAMNAVTELIKERTETYILNKAAEMGSEVVVDVKLGEGMLPAPKEVTVSGAVSPYVKSQLADCLQQELGIAEENQIWIS